MWPNQKDLQRDQGVWGSFRLVGTFDVDEQVFTLTEMPVLADEVPTGGRPIQTGRVTEPPCPTPSSGWIDPDASMNDEAAADRMKDLARRSPDWTSLSVTERKGFEIWTVGFTGDLDRHREELRTVWGGGLCIVKQPVDAATLAIWRDRLGPEFLEGRLDYLHPMTLGANPDDGTILMGVMWAPPGTEQRASARYGIPISLDRRLRPEGES